MNNIKLEKYRHDSRRNRYEVHLHNNAFAYFSNAKETKKFLSETSVVLTNSLRAINENYKQIFNVTQSFYFDLDNRQSLEYKSIIDRINERLDFICYRYWAKENSFYFQATKKICDLLFELLEFAKNNLVKIKFTGFFSQLEVIELQLKSVIISIEHLVNRYSREQIVLFKYSPSPKPNEAERLQLTIYENHLKTA